MSENDSVIISEELFNKLLAYRLQYNEYNNTEPEILRKLFYNLINYDNLTANQANNILKNFYLFNTFGITHSEINSILEDLVILHGNNTNNTNNTTQIHNINNLPPSIQNLLNRYPILNSRISQTMSNNYRPLVTHANNDSFIFDFDRTTNSFQLSESNVYQPPYNQLADLPNISNLRLVRNPIINNVINNQLLFQGIQETSPANIIFAPVPRQLMTLNYTSQILEGITSVINNRINNLNTMEDIPIVLKEEEFNNFPKYKYKDLDSEFKKEYTSCPISMQDYEDETILVKLPCVHYFSIDFAKTWLLENSHKCPLCRKSAGETEAKIN